MNKQSIRQQAIRHYTYNIISVILTVVLKGVISIDSQKIDNYNRLIYTTLSLPPHPTEHQSATGFSTPFTEPFSPYN